MLEPLKRIHREYLDRLETKTVVLESGALGDCVAPLRSELADGLWLLVCDEKTWEAAGKAAAAAMQASGRRYARWLVAPPEGHEDAVCDEESVSACREAIGQLGAAAVVGVGSGTINDIAKFAAHKAGVSAGCVATAPSMNGYTSAIAAVLTNGVKTTQPCRPTRVVVADVDVMAAAPAPLIQSGIGDLASKPVSNADWIVANRLTGSTHSPDAARVIEASWRLLSGVAPGLARREPEAIEKLGASLLLSGFAMTVAGNSAPASGGEHLISHYLDMVAIAEGSRHDLHGRQVGVGTITAALFYEKLRALDPSTIDPDARLAGRAPWKEYDKMLRGRFGDLSDAVLGHARAGYPDPDGLRERLEKLRSDWSSIMEELGATLRSPGAIESELRDAGAPTRYKELGVSKDRALRAITESKDIRSRYTILHLAWELGYLDQWAAEAIDRYYD
jgi:glycerol-1-phosphate dehydrogenase [NAD(P)+]